MSKIGLKIKALHDEYIEFRYLDRVYAGQYGAHSAASRFPLARFACDWLRASYLALICRLRDHKIDTVDGWCGPDSGGEEFECSRCGWSQRITYY